MGSKRHTDSVLAKLMGLDKPQALRPPCGRQRVLSESYLQNIASIASVFSVRRRENWSFREDDSIMDVDGQQETKVASEGLQSPSMKEHHTLPITDEIARLSIDRVLGVGKKLQGAGLAEDQRSQHFGTSACVSLVNQDSEEITRVRASGKWERVNLSQKVKPHSFAHSQIEVSQKKKEASIPIRRLYETHYSGTAHHVGKKLSTASSLKGHWNHSSSSLRNKRIYSEAGGRKCFKVGTGPHHDINSRGEIAKRVSSEVKKSAWYQYSSLPGSHSNHNDTIAKERGKSMLPSPCWPANKEDKKQSSPSSTSDPLTLSPRGKSRHFTLHRDWCLKPGESNLFEIISLREDNIYAEWGLERRKSESLLRLDSQDTKPASEISSIIGDLNILGAENLSEGTSIVQPSGYASACSDIEVLSDHENQTVFAEICGVHDSDLPGKDSSISKQLMDIFAASGNDVEDCNVAENEDLGLSLERQMTQQSELSSHIHKDGDSTFDDLNAPIKPFRDDALIPSHFAETETEYTLSSTQRCDVSPDSILESKDIFLDAESVGLEQLGNDIHELQQQQQQQLQLLKNKSFESYFEGPGMMVSSDEDSEGGFVIVGDNIGNEEMMRSSYNGTQESRDFSLSDVLSEMGSDAVPLSEHGPDPSSLFDVLEKKMKYTKQTAVWPVSDRRLLFDRINLGLMELHGSRVGSSCTRPKGFLSLRNLENIEEELGALLVDEERKAARHRHRHRQGSSDKEVGTEAEWLELGEEMDSIAKEIEQGLIDQLVSEMTTMES